MWLILKTDIAKEFAVAEALTALGHECWVPTYVCEVRERKVMGPGVTVRVRKAKERPLLPSLLFMMQPEQWWTMPSTRHLLGVWSDAFERRLMVHPDELAVFRARVEEVNAAETARIMKARLGKRKGKRTVKLDPTLADELKAMLFGRQAQEAA